MQGCVLFSCNKTNTNNTNTFSRNYYYIFFSSLLRSSERKFSAFLWGFSPLKPPQKFGILVIRIKNKNRLKKCSDHRRFWDDYPATLRRRPQSRRVLPRHRGSAAPPKRVFFIPTLIWVTRRREDISRPLRLRRRKTIKKIIMRSSRRNRRKLCRTNQWRRI
jgi:hypothetical protein